MGTSPRLARDMPSSIRALIPRALRRRAAAPVGQYRGARIRSRLAALAAGQKPILAGPWLGEVGFEILYWAPFVRWFASEFDVAPERLTVLSRGGTRTWYDPAARHYRDVFDYVSPDEYKHWHEERVGEVGEQKQTRMTVRERSLLDQVLGSADADVLHPSAMYELMNPYWWHHLGEGWIHQHTRYVALPRPPRIDGLPARYVAVKFYFNDCFPATDENRAFVRDITSELARHGAIVSLSAGVALDDHRGCTVSADEVAVPGPIKPAHNLGVQSAIVAHAEAFVGTYGGFAYLAPFYGVRSTSYYRDDDGFARSHLAMAQSALAAIGARDLLQVEPAGHAARKLR